MSLLSRAVEILRTEGLRGLITGIRRFLYFRIPNRRLPLQLYYLARGKVLRRSENGWCLHDIRSRNRFYFPQLQSHALHTDRHIEFLEKTYFSGNGVRVEPGDIVFDVGAYIGVTSRVAARNAEHVFAIEPSPRARASLAKNTEEYENIEIISCAVSDENSELELQFGNDITDDSLIDPDDGGSGETVTVPVKTIEQLANDLDVPTIDFLKVEAEGLEPEVVRGSVGAPVKKSRSQGTTNDTAKRHSKKCSGFCATLDSMSTRTQRTYRTTWCMVSVMKKQSEHVHFAVPNEPLVDKYRTLLVSQGA